MALANYSDLVTAVGDWSWRSDDTTFIARIPDLIRLAELDIQRRLRVNDMLAETTITMTNGSGSLPADYLQYRRVWETAYPNYDLEPGKEINGRGFRIVGSTIYGYPEASIGNLGMEYYQEIPALTSSNTTNWLMTKWPDCYLFGTLVIAFPSEREDERIQLFNAKFEDVMRKIEVSDTMVHYANARIRRRRGCATP